MNQIPDQKLEMQGYPIKKILNQKVANLQKIYLFIEYAFSRLFLYDFNAFNIDAFISF